MKRYLLDTGIASDYINRRHGVFEKANAAVRGGARIGVCVPVAGELLAGVELSDTRERNMERLLRALKSFHIWPYELPAAKEFGRLVAVLKRAGRTMQQIDVQIAAIAFTLGEYRDPSEVFEKFFRRRKAIDLSKGELGRVVLDRVGERQRLYFDHGADRVEIGECLREPEREWLAAVIQEWQNES